MEPAPDNDIRPEGLNWRLVLGGLAVMLALGCGIFFLMRREPRYGGKSLAAWLDEMGPPGAILRTDGPEKAIHAMGAKAVPRLIFYLKPASPPPAFLDKLDDWLTDRIDLSISLPREKDRQFPALEALRMLGPVAEPAITNLAALLGDGAVGGHAAACLAAIGPAAFPALTNAFASTNTQIRASALGALADLGTNAAGAAPLIAARMHDPSRSLGDFAVMVLGELGAPAEPFVPDLERMLQERDHPQTAAITLSSLGQTASLLRALTNLDETVRESAAEALDPRLAAVRADRRKYHLIGGSENEAAFLMMFMQRNLAGAYQGGNSSRMTDLLLTHFGDPDPAVRALVADRLGDHGIQAARALPALSNALSDPSELVRQSAAAALKKIDAVVYQGGIIRGPRKEKKIALEFTGHTFAEGGTVILDELARHHARASFFVTGDFLGNPEFRPLVERIVREGHYLGPHSDKHLLYCPWDNPINTLVSHEVFARDLSLNKMKARRFADAGVPITYWLPAFEWYNEEIAEWGRELDLTLVNYTPGTRSNADYTQESDPNFVSSQAIYDSIVKREQTDPDGLNGFLLLMHLGAGPGRADRLCDHLGALLDHLSAKGYQFVRIDELLDPTR